MFSFLKPILTPVGFEKNKNKNKNTLHTYIQFATFSLNQVLLLIIEKNGMWREEGDVKNKWDQSVVKYAIFTCRT